MIKVKTIHGEVLYIQPSDVSYMHSGECDGGTATALGIAGQRFWVIETPQEIAEHIVAYTGFQQDYASASRRLMEMRFDPAGVGDYKRSVMDALIP
ncbi:hypothetical protein M3223_04145 [Paenibacillus pasadenensis]|uniref:hypothetical protein n=1 Tax=Paenibacillus pasadenensis TaxID=217090 RepID=UPI0020420ECB|nr:hypothetical protein [Paenibacillus pasadenensis]MCM3746540.1 hypothetical protein [Paenibacillus pasadenensis]